MIRCHQRKVGVRFHPDCPDHVKQRSFAGMCDAMPTDQPPRIPRCDHEWVTRIDERIPGWWIPLIGFVSDDSFKTLAKRVRATVARLLG